MLKQRLGEQIQKEGVSNDKILNWTLADVTKASALCCACSPPGCTLACLLMRCWAASKLFAACTGRRSCCLASAACIKVWRRP